MSTQELSAVAEPKDLQETSLVGNHEVYMKSFTAYSAHYHDFLAMNGVTHLVDKVE